MRQTFFYPIGSKKISLSVLPFLLFQLSFPFGRGFVLKERQKKEEKGLVEKRGVERGKDLVGYKTDSSQ